MAKKKNNYTQEDYNKLRDELNYLKNVRREEIKEDIAVARSYGDLSENAEYDEARNEQAKVELQIKELEELINNATVINENEVDSSIVSVGSTVTVEDLNSKKEITYQIVGSNGANPFENKISDQSPIGKELINKRAGDSVIVTVPNGTVRYEVVKVMRSHHGGH